MTPSAKSCYKSANMETVEAPYILRARFCGVIDFTCHWCAQICRAVRVTRKTFKIRCTGKECRRWFGLGLVLHVLPRAGNGGSIPLEDYVIPAPADPMPIAELNEWRRGDPMHLIQCPDAP
jgi:hypothetical protein